jgi:hypothetical protein
MRVAIAICALLAVVAAARAQTPAPPHAEVGERVHDAGTVDQGTVVRHTFILKNVGPGELSVDAKPG